MGKRKAFNFYVSYFDVYNEIESNDEKLQFIDALLKKQFLGIEPTELKGLAKFGYNSQKEIINSQVVGWEKKTKTTLGGVGKGGIEPLTDPPSLQEKGEEKGEEKEELNTIIINEAKANEVFMKYRENYKTYATFIYKDKITRNSLRDTFFKLANTDEILALTLKHYLGLFLKHLDITKELHQTQKSFVNHFPNWLRKQNSLEIIKPKQQPIRYV